MSFNLREKSPVCYHSVNSEICFHPMQTFARKSNKPLLNIEFSLPQLALDFIFDLLPSFFCLQYFNSSCITVELINGVIKSTAVSRVEGTLIVKMAPRILSIFIARNLRIYYRKSPPQPPCDPFQLSVFLFPSGINFNVSAISPDDHSRGLPYSSAFCPSFADNHSWNHQTIESTPSSAFYYSFSSFLSSCLLGYPSAGSFYA